MYTREKTTNQPLMLLSTKGVATAVAAAMAAPIFAASACVSSVELSTFPCDAAGSSGDSVVVGGEVAFGGGCTTSDSAALGCKYKRRTGVGGGWGENGIKS